MSVFWVPTPVDLYVDTNFLKKYIFSIFNPEDEGIVLLLNVGISTYIPHSVTTRRPSLTHSLP
jgi:hypothetical protein